MDGDSCWQPLFYKMFYDELNMFTYARLRDIIWLSKWIFEDKGWSAVSAYP